MGATGLPGGFLRVNRYRKPALAEPIELCTNKSGTADALFSGFRLFESFAGETGLFLFKGSGFRRKGYGHVRFESGSESGWGLQL